MKNELMTNIVKEVVEEVSTGNRVSKISNAFQNIVHGKNMIAANEKVDLRKLEAQENILKEKIRADGMTKHEKAEIAKAALKTVESLSKDGTLTDTIAVTVFNYVIAVNNDLQYSKLNKKREQNLSE